MSPQHHDDEDQAEGEVTFGEEWTVTPRVAAGVLGIEQRRVLHLVETGVLAVRYEGRVRLIELDSLLAYRRRRPLPRNRPVTHPADLDTDKEHRTHDR